MLRRHAVSLLLGSAAGLAAKNRASLARFLDPGMGSVLIVDVAERRLLATNGLTAAGATLAAPGSTIKPLVLAALLQRGKLGEEDPFYCPAKLEIERRRFDCTHPSLPVPMVPHLALAYSCNCYVAHAAERLAKGELAEELTAAGLATRSEITGPDEITGTVETELSGDGQKIQALGETGVQVTPVGLVLAYRQLALHATRAQMRVVIEGLEEAVEFGTAQNARIAGVKVAGKTGTTRNGRQSIAWFAGFCPSRSPEVVVAVMVAGRSGGADAAPIAAQVLAAYRGHAL